MAGKERPRPPLPRWGPSLLVFLLALAVYSNSFPGSFITDDLPIVRDNHLVADADITGIFTSDYWGEGINSGLYRPLTILSYTVNRLLFGSDVISYHLINVILHGGVSLVLLHFMHTLRLPRLTAWVGAALFAVHPIHTEVVNEVVGRAELLAALFLLVALSLSLKKGRGQLAAAVLCYGAALLCKEHAVVFLPLLLLADLYLSKRTAGAFKGRGRFYFALALVTLAWLGLRQWVAAGTGVPPDAAYGADNPLAFLPPVARILTALKVQVLYLGKLVFPWPLMAVYDGGRLDKVQSILSPWGLVVTCLVLLAIFVLLRGWRRRAGLAFGIAFYAVSFSVTANLFFVIAVFMAERLAYLPSAGYSIAAASFLTLSSVPAGERLLRRKIGTAVGLGYLILLGGLTLARNPDFKDPIRLYEAAVREDAGSARGWYHLGSEHEKAGFFGKAEAAYRSSIGADPSFPDVYTAYSGLLLRRGRVEEALETAMEGVRLLAGGAGPALLQAAAASLELGRPAEALEWLGRGERVYGTSPFYWETRARALDALGERTGAIESYREVFRLGGDPGLVRRLAVLLLESERYAEAEGILRNVITRDAADADGFNLLGVALGLQGQSGEAQQAFRRAVELDPSSDIYRANLEREEEEVRGGGP